MLLYLRNYYCQYLLIFFGFMRKYSKNRAWSWSVISFINKRNSPFTFSLSKTQTHNQNRSFSYIFLLSFLWFIRFPRNISFFVVTLRPNICTTDSFLFLPYSDVEISKGKFSVPLRGNFSFCSCPRKFSFLFLSAENFLSENPP